MKFIDAFAGIGGFRLAAGSLARCVASIEFDPECQKTYLANFGETPIGDITKIDLETLPDHDFLFAGFPCQPFSKNGKYNKTNGTVVAGDERKDLFKYLEKILILKQPSFFVFENVKELLSIKDEAGDFFVANIVFALEKAGYRVYYQVLNSNDFGLAQQRHRVYFVGIRDDLGFPFEFPKGFDSTRKVKDVLQSVVDDKYLLKNFWDTHRLIDSPAGLKEKKKKNHTFEQGALRLDVIEQIYNMNRDKPKKLKSIQPVAVLYGDTPSGLPRQQDKLYSKDGVCPTLTTFELTVPAFDIGNSKDSWRVLTPRECARLQGFPESFILPKPDALAYRQLGNAVSVPVVTEILRVLAKGFWNYSEKTFIKLPRDVESTREEQPTG